VTKILDTTIISV